jgi:hypothetical protein
MDRIDVPQHVSAVLCTPVLGVLPNDSIVEAQRCHLAFLRARIPTTSLAISSSKHGGTVIKHIDESLIRELSGLNYQCFGLDPLFIPTTEWNGLTDGLSGSTMR